MSFVFSSHLLTPILCAKELITLAEGELCDSDSPVTATVFVISGTFSSHILRGTLAEGLEIREENKT